MCRLHTQFWLELEIAKRELKLSCSVPDKERAQVQQHHTTTARTLGFCDPRCLGRENRNLLGGYLSIEELVVNLGLDLQSCSQIYEDAVLLRNWRKQFIFVVSEMHDTNVLPGAGITRGHHRFRIYPCDVV